MKKYNSKINKIRSFALSLIFIGFVVMYGGIFFRDNPILVILFMGVGLLCVIGSTIIYAWIGYLPVPFKSNAQNAVSGRKF